jgi:hypothetical protein
MMLVGLGASAYIRRDVPDGTIRALDRELREAKEFVQSIDDGEFDHLFRDAGMKAGVRAAMQEHFRTYVCAEAARLAHKEGGLPRSTDASRAITLLLFPYHSITQATQTTR